MQRTLSCQTYFILRHVHPIPQYDFAINAPALLTLSKRILLEVTQNSQKLHFELQKQSRIFFLRNAFSNFEIDSSNIMPGHDYRRDSSVFRSRSREWLSEKLGTSELSHCHLAARIKMPSFRADCVRSNRSINVQFCTVVILDSVFLGDKTD